MTTAPFLTPKAGKELEREISDAEARTHLARWREYRGRTPFGNMSSGSATDRANGYLGNASAILCLLSAAFEDAGELGDKSELTNLHSRIICGALEGVDDLIMLASFAMED